jgi:hypothetical protein
VSGDLRRARMAAQQKGPQCPWPRCLSRRSLRYLARRSMPVEHSHGRAEIGAASMGTVGSSSAHPARAWRVVVAGSGAL